MSLISIDSLDIINLELEKSITRAEAKKAHKELPPGGTWRTMNGHHIYIKDGKVLAGAVPAAKGGAKKATKAQLKGHQETIDKEAKKPKKAAPKKPAPKQTVKSKTKEATPPIAKKANAYLKNRTKAELIDKIREYSRYIADNIKDKKHREAFNQYLVGAANNDMAKYSMNFIEWAAKASDNALKQLPKETLLNHASTLQDKYNHFIDHQTASTKKPAAKAKKDKAKADAAKARKELDAIANSRPKEPKKRTPKLKEAKAQVEEALKTPNPKTKGGKGATKKDVELVVKENAKRKKSTAKGATKADLDNLVKENAKRKKTTPKTTTKTSEAKKTTKKEKVADIRTEKQVNHVIAYDVGKKVGGSRKDTATKRTIDSFVNGATGQKLAELEALSPELAQKYCVKKNLLNPVDFEVEYKKGTDINVAMCKRLVYDRIQPKPNGDTPKDREEYLNAIKSLQRVLEPIKSWDEFTSAIRNLGYHMKSETPHFLQEQHKYLDYAKKEAEREPKDYELKRQYNFKTKEYEDITPEQWKAKKQARVKEVEQAIAGHFEAAKAPYSPLGEKLTGFFTDYEKRNRTIDTINKKKLDWNNYFEEAKQANEAPKEPKGAKNKRKWERIMPARIQRTGGRASKVEKPEDMVKNFGFSGIEFGNWVDDVSGNFHMKKCAEAFMDLADIIGVKDKDVSFNGKLSMAFGARGKGGALAHYEPGTKAINITKEGGAGSLAHEWGHALDNMMYQESAGYSSLSFASNGLQDKGSPAVKAAYKDVMSAILNGSGKDYVENKHKKYYMYHPSFKQAVETVGLEQAIKSGTALINDRSDKAIKHYEDLRSHFGDELVDKKIAGEERKRKLAINDMVQEMAYIHTKHTGEQLDNIPVYTGKSQYYIDSSKHGGKGNTYWTSGEELFARAFENYIEGKMKSGKVKNDYLVSGTYLGSGIPDFPAPYPQGEERKNIHKAFDKLMDAIRRSGAIQKALAITELSKGYYKDKLIAMQERKDPEGIVSQRDRNAYNVSDISEVFFIPVNRLRTPYQTEAAFNFEKIKENVGRMKSGDALEPVQIGYDYDVHDGHHRLEASKIVGYSHVPCVVKGSNDLDVQRAKEAYGELWKSILYEFNDSGQFPYEATGLMFRGIGQRELDFIKENGCIKSKGKGNDGDQEDTVTCFSQLFSQAEGYARGNYDLYNEKAAYVLAVEQPEYATENELGELEIHGSTPASKIKGIIQVPKCEIV